MEHSILAHKYNDLSECPVCANLADIETQIAETNAEVYRNLAERARWYREGCEGLEDREGYYASGDCARDAASDLEAALSEIRVLESVIARFRGQKVAEQQP